MEARVTQLEEELEKSKKELAFRIKHYEAKLATLTVINGALQSENDKLKEENAELAAAGGGSRSPGKAEQELKELHEEFTRRLGAAEKAASTLKDTVLSLRDQLASANGNTAQAEKKLQEREAAVAQLQADGSRLTKRMGELEVLNRKLRSDVATAESEKDKLVAQLQVLGAAAQTSERDRSAELANLKHSLEAAQRALAEQKEYYVQALSHKEETAQKEVERVRMDLMGANLAAQKRLAEQQAAYLHTIEALRESLGAAQNDACLREEKLRKEMRELGNRCRSAELAAEGSSTQLSQATRPLLRQMEALQVQVAERDSAAQSLHQEVETLEEELAAVTEAKQKLEALYSTAEIRTQTAEKALKERKSEGLAQAARVKESEGNIQGLKKEIQEVITRALEAEAERENVKADLAALRAAKEVSEANAKRELLQAKQELEEEKKKLQEEKATLSQQRSLPRTSSFGGESATSSADVSSPRERHSESDTWQARRAPRASDPLADLGKGLAGGTTAVNERLLAKLRQFQGEVGQLQREVLNLRAQRSREAEDLVKVSQKANQLETEAKQAGVLRSELEELRKRHEVALVIIGERNERAEELEADMADVKSLYREQINLLINQVDPKKWPEGYRICLYCSHCAQVHRRRS